jgi:hypothetical protein
MAPAGRPVNAERFRLTLFSAGRPVQHGWWASEATARGKFRDWVGSGVADARVVLVDEATGETLDEWPQARPGVVGGAP